ncbi:hypothetical protein C1645_870358 [Glomus cerebriforme]|uniref:F-box domain-containing protein n=1 Tax=Glomus cerebriforme TaxID=658196 RepID=A0A397TR80_9GLOM|nr:hypothetical protein C1645_870358 [Glomus cerebriforme]
MTKLKIDCFILIFGELLRMKHSLNACLLVNKEWCNLVVPILWKSTSAHYYFKNDELEKKWFNTILSCISPSSKQLLFDNNIELPSTILLKSPLFNYISFCEFPEAIVINKIVEMWETLQPLPSFPGASICFSQLRRLCIDIDLVNPNNIYKLAQICKDLNELSINNCYQDFPGLITLIDVQRNLKSVELHNSGTFKELGNALARKKNMINYLYSYLISSISLSFLTSLINLKEISIYNYCNEYDEDFKHYFEISEFPDLEHLQINHLSCFKEISFLIEKTKGNISIIYIHTNNENIKNTGMLVKAIANNCPNIKRLTTYLDSRDFIYVKSLLLNCRYLELIRFDSMNTFIDEDDNTGDELLDILIKFSPNSLTKITISGRWKYSNDTFERFFESYRERTLSYFAVIFSDMYYITLDQVLMIRKYIEERVIKSTK